MKVPDQVMVMDMINWVAGLGAQHATKNVKQRTGVQLMHEVKSTCAARYPVSHLEVTWLPAHRIQLRRVYHAAYALTKYSMEVR